MGASRTRHLATSPSRRHASSPSQLPRTPHLVLLYSYSVRRYVAFCFIQFYCTTYTYYCTCTHFAFTSRGSANLRISVALFTCLSRGRALCVTFHSYVLSSDSRRIYVALRLNHYASLDLCVNKTPHYLSSRRASRVRLYPSAAAVFISVFLHCSFLFLIAARQHHSLARNRLCYSRLANTTRSAVLRLNRIDSPPRL